MKRGLSLIGAGRPPGSLATSASIIWPAAAYGCAPGSRRKTPRSSVSAGQIAFAGERRVWDSNPRGSSRPLAVFKTAAIGH